MQERTSTAIVEALDLEIGSEERRRLLDRPIEDIRAYECYLRARHEALKGTAKAFENAIRELEVGLQILGENGLLHYGLADTLMWACEYGVMSTEYALEMAEKHAAKVIEIRPHSANSHYLKGRLERFSGNPTETITHMDRALAQDSSHLGAMAFALSIRSMQIGKPASAEGIARRLAEIDPLNPLTTLQIGWHQWFSGRLEEARSTFERCSTLEPSFLWAPLFKAYVLLWEDRGDERFRTMISPLAYRWQTFDPAHSA